MVLNFAICKMLMFFQRWCLDFPNWLFFLSSSTWGLFILEYFHKLQFVPNFVFVTQMSPDLIVNTQTFALGDDVVIRNSKRWNFTPITVPKTQIKLFFSTITQKSKNVYLKGTPGNSSNANPLVCKNLNFGTFFKQCPLECEPPKSAGEVYAGDLWKLRQNSNLCRWQACSWVALD